MLGAREQDVGRGAQVARGLRARHYWDGEGLLMKGYRQTLALAGPAWDIYLLHAPDATWAEDALPTPVFWMHQLGEAAPGPALDPERFAAQALRLLDAD